MIFQTSIVYLRGLSLYIGRTCTSIKTKDSFLFSSPTQGNNVTPVLLIGIFYSRPSNQFVGHNSLTKYNERVLPEFALNPSIILGMSNI